MRCIICDSNDWQNVDEFRLKPQGMSMCKSCGFVSYPSLWKSKEEIIAHYREDYRSPPTSSNLYSGQRKCKFHDTFLGDVFREWKEKDKKEPKVFEIGAAYGMALKFITDIYPGSVVDGSELTESYKRNAYHEYGFRLKDDFDDSKKYDLIMSYKVAEHQLDVDKEIERYANSLTDDGYVYISVPIWFETMHNFGVGGFDIEYYYDKNHINVWHRAHFESLLDRAGLEIVKEDHFIYDSTYLCKKGDKKKNLPFPKPSEVLENLAKIKAAYEFFVDQKYAEAIDIWPDYPAAHQSRFEMIRKQASVNGFEWTMEHVISPALEACGERADVLCFVADVCMRFNRFKEAINFCERSLKSRPDNPASLQQMINIMREMALTLEDPKAKLHYMHEAREISRHLRMTSLQHIGIATDLTYMFNSKLPIPPVSNKRTK